MGHGRRLGLLLAAALALPAPALAAPPGNDDFSASLGGAFTTRSAPASFSGTLDGATRQAGEPDHAQSGTGHTETVWYGFTAPRDGLVTMTTCDGASHQLDTELAVYTGTAVDALHEVASNTDAIDTAVARSECMTSEQLSVLSFRAAAGTPYRVAVAGLGTQQDFTLRIGYGPWAYSDTLPGVRLNPVRQPLTLRVLSPTAGATLRCRLDGDPFSACPEYARFWDRDVADGTHTLQVVGSAGGDAFPFPYGVPFVVDTTPPQTSTDGAPHEMSGRGYWWEIPLRTSEFGQETQGFACSIDGAAAVRCAPAFADSGKGEIGLIYQCAGRHTVDSSGFDSVGNVDPTPVHSEVTVPESAGTGGCAPPAVRSEQAHFIGPTGAMVSANVAPSGLGTDFTIEYGTTAGYGERTLPVYANGSTTEVQADDTLYFLEPSTTYHARLVARNREGTAATPDITFTTRAPSGPAPTARVTPAARVTATTAALNGAVAAPDACHQAYYGFDLGTDTRYGTRFLPAGGQLSCDASEWPVRMMLTGLRPGTTYHYRLLAGNAGGVTRSGDMAFTTAGTPGSTTGGAGPGPVAPGAVGGSVGESAPPPPADVAAFSEAAPPPAAAVQAGSPEVRPATPTVVTPRIALRAAVAALAQHLPGSRRLTFSWPAAGRLTLRWHAGRRTLGAATATRARAGRQAVALRLTRAGRAKRLPRSELVATFTPRAGAALRASATLRPRGARARRR